MSTLQVANIHLESTGNNRVQFTGSNTMALVVAGANSINIIANGNVGVGTNAPAATLDVSGSVSIAKANVLSQTLSFVASPSSISWNAASGQIAYLTLTGTGILATPTNLKVGTYILHVIQDGVGGRTMTWGSVFKWTGGAAPTLSTSANARDLFSFVCDGTNLYGSFMPDVR